MKTTITLIAVLAFSIAAQASPLGANGIEGEQRTRFDEIDNLPWKEAFFDSGTDNWKAKWSLDGLKSKVTHTSRGMNLQAGPIPKENASHTVLWTKKRFKGDLKIEYEYTRTDQANQYVNILYIQATGSGEKGFPKSIAKWADRRTIPTMATYYNHMNTYHISYAAYGAQSVEEDYDYIRLRRYRPDLKKGLKGTEIEPDIFQRTSLFKTDVSHQITVIKRGNEIFMMIRNPDKDYLCHWENNQHPAITEGAIGLRHMFTRSARYSNFRVSTLD